MNTPWEGSFLKLRRHVVMFVFCPRPVFPQQSSGPSCLMEKKCCDRTTPHNSPALPRSSPHPSPVNHPAQDMTPPSGCMCVCVCVGGWRVPEWLSPQIVMEAHGKFAPQAKPQAFSIISADFFFFIPIQKSDYDRLFFFSLSFSKSGFLGFPRCICTLLRNVPLFKLGLFLFFILTTRTVSTAFHGLFGHLR